MKRALVFAVVLLVSGASPALAKAPPFRCGTVLVHPQRLHHSRHVPVVPVVYDLCRVP